MTEFNHRFSATASTLFLFIAAVLSLVGSTGCSGGNTASAEQPVPKVTVSEVVSQETIDADEYTGRTEASEIVQVRARVFGYLKSIEFKDGDFVKEDQLLFTIEPDEYRAINKQSLSRIELATARNDLAKAKLARDAKLVETGAVSKEEHEESIAAVKESDAAINTAKADAERTAVDLKYTEIKAPISGRIDRALVTKGNLLTGGQATGTLLTTIVSENPMHVYFDVDERSLLRYMRQRAAERESAPGSLRESKMSCFVKLADETDFGHQGTLDFASNEVNVTTGTARIRGVFSNEDRALASGLFVRMRVPIGKPYQALMIPERSLGTQQSIKFVYVVGDDGTAERRIVELGGQRGDMRIIKSGLKAGERVIVKGLQRVKPGQKVEAEVAPATPPPSDQPNAEAKNESESSSKPASTPSESKTPPESTPSPATKEN